ncbi:cytochrome c [Betaproteobacteria bacterium]|nr:cytochrome c [Betaproteobacteria bacterium]
MGNFWYKNFKRFSLGFFGLWFCFGFSCAIAAGNIEAGANKVSMCVGCHGIPNYKTAFPKTYRVPRIAGQKVDYLVSALKAYREGQRSHPSMKAVAGSMTDADIADIAAYYSSLN